MKGLYIFRCPLAQYTKRIACKIGITGSWWARFSGYQNSYSRLNHKACFDLVYVGPPRAINLLEKISLKGIPVNVNWYFEQDDEDMEEAGEDYQAILKLPFKMIEVDEI